MPRKTLCALAFALALAACGGEQNADDPTAADAQDLGEAASACGKVTWKNYAGAFFQVKCASCHQQQYGTLAKVKASGAQREIAAGAMPQGKKLTAATKKKILAWFACGAP
jgi:hypothetical protein